MSLYTNSKIYSLVEYLLDGLSVSAPTRPLATHRFCTPFTHRSGSRPTQPMRPMLSLYLNTPPQAQLEALLVLPDHLALIPSGFTPRSHSSTRLILHASTLPVGLSTRTAFLSSLVFASSVSLSSAWPSVDSASPNQTSEPNRLPSIGFRSHPTWLFPTRL